MSQLKTAAAAVCAAFVCFVGLLGCEPTIPPAPAGNTSTPATTATTATTAATTATPSTPSGEASSPTTTALKRIIILTNGNSPYWDACRSGLNDAERELKLAEAGLDAVFEVNDGSPAGQIDKLKQYASQTDIVAIGVSPVDAANVAIADEMRALQKRGVKIACIDADVDRERLRDARYAYLGTDNLVGGKVLGQCAAALRPDGGEYATFVGRTGALTAIQRIGGFGIGAGDKFTITDSMADDFDKSRARENVRNAVRNHPRLAVLVGIYSYNAPAIVDICKELSLRSGVRNMTVVTFDAEPQAIVDMKAGQIDAMVVQDPYAMGYQGVRLLKALVDDDQPTLKEMYPRMGEPDGDLFDTGLKVVVPSDDSPAGKLPFEGKVQVLTLEKFQGWLDQYGLQGS